MCVVFRSVLVDDVDGMGVVRGYFNRCHTRRWSTSRRNGRRGGVWLLLVRCLGIEFPCVFSRAGVDDVIYDVVA